MSAHPPAGGRIASEARFVLTITAQTAHAERVWTGGAAYSVRVAEGPIGFVGQPARLPNGPQAADLRSLAGCATRR